MKSTKRFWTTFVVWFTTPLLLLAQAPKEDFFRHYSLTRPKLQTFEIHVTKSPSGLKKPLLIYLDGSGNFPIFYKTTSGRYSTSVPLDVKKYAQEYHVVLISKPGVPFKDSLRLTSSGRRYYPENETYTSLYSLDWRAETAAEAINFLVKKLAVDTRKVVVMGYSEGSQVAPKVAVLNKKVTHVVCFAGNALNHLYDFLIEARVQAEQQQLTPAEGQKMVDSLYAEYGKIYANPTSTKDSWNGATYLKWSSFSKTTPLENMLKLSIPILYVAGGQDRNQTILDMDYAKLEFMRQGKSNLTYKVYPNCNHFFQEKTAVGDTPKTTDRIDEVHQFAFDWVNSLGK